uniref:Putative secreted protein n=1 Tax=Ixodes ricinus TaxID=34613 RepID=A0A147BQL8_IXORI
MFLMLFLVRCSSRISGLSVMGMTSRAAPAHCTVSLSSLQTQRTGQKAWARAATKPKSASRARSWGTLGGPLSRAIGYSSGCSWC